MRRATTRWRRDDDDDDARADETRRDATRTRRRARRATTRAMTSMTTTTRTARALNARCAYRAMRRVVAAPIAAPTSRPRRARAHVPAHAGWNDFAWSKATVVANERRARTPEAELRTIGLEIGAAARAAYATPGQFLQIRTREDGKAAFIAIASAPGECAYGEGAVELLVKAQSGTTAAEICALDVGAEVDVSPAMGKGFDLTAVRGRSNAVLFATGSGISPIRALLRSGTLQTRADATTVYYGTRDAEATAFLEESATWPCDVVRVYSEDSGRHVQDILREDIASGKIDVNDTFAVLCGQKEMADEVIEMLTAAGVPREACVMNF
jgi:NAD(P)H-flavin reductase